MKAIVFSVGRPSPRALARPLFGLTSSIVAHASGDCRRVTFVRRNEPESGSIASDL
jgi:hypothetical protein